MNIYTMNNNDIKYTASNLCSRLLFSKFETSEGLHNRDRRERYIDVETVLTLPIAPT